MDLQKLIDFRFEPVEHDLTWRDTILYALGLGYGSDPNDPAQLQFVYEEGLKAVPAMACVMGYPGFWMRRPELAIDWVRLLHGEHAYRIHHPLPVAGLLRAEHAIRSVVDKGRDKGAVVTFEKSLYDTSGLLLATIAQSNFLRGDGGCGNFGIPPEARPALPEGPPDFVYEIETTRQIALIYRLSGDYNPVHVDPEVARKAGFHEPWIAGMCSMGMATRAAMACLCDDDPGRVAAMSVRFRNVCFPGETMRYEFYRSDTGARFRVTSKERGCVVLDRGDVTITS